MGLFTELNEKLGRTIQVTHEAEMAALGEEDHHLQGRGWY